MELDFQIEYLWYLFAKQSFSYEKQIRFILDEIPPKDYQRILDLGCGAGLHVSQLEKFGYICTGIDINTMRIKLAQKLNLRRNGTSIFYTCNAKDFRLDSNMFDAAFWMNVPLSFNILTGEFLDCITHNVRMGGRIVFDYLIADPIYFPKTNNWIDELEHPGDDILPYGIFQRNVFIDYNTNPWTIHWHIEQIKPHNSSLKIKYKTTLPTVIPSKIRHTYEKNGWKHLKELLSDKIEFDGIYTGLCFILDLFEKQAQTE